MNVITLLFILETVFTGPRQGLVPNPGFEVIEPGKGMPVSWESFSPRNEIAPEFGTDKTVFHSGKSSAVITSKGSPGTYGYLKTYITGLQYVPKELTKEGLTIPDSVFLGNKYFDFGCYFRTAGKVDPDRNVTIFLSWKDKNGKELSAEYVNSYTRDGEWFHAMKSLRAPAYASGLEIQLVLQWTAAGKVWWDDVSLDEVKHAGGAGIKVATSTTRPPAPSTTEKNLEFYSDKIIAAGKAGDDLLCLGEGITIVSTQKTFQEAAETIPGPATKVLGAAAAKAHLYVVAGLYERDGSLIYNTAVLIDRNGKVAGKYRKTHLPHAEVIGGLTPGSEYPVFRTDFGTIGIEICYDNFFPEVARSLAMKGADIILNPIWGDVRGDNNEWDIVARTRAIDNAVFFISSMYDGRDGSLIIDPDGKILGDKDHIKGLASAEINLSSRTFEHWLSVSGYGEWKNLVWKERNAGTYQGLVKMR